MLVPLTAVAGPSQSGLTEPQTLSLAARYREAQHWSMKGIVLLAFGERWHPAGTETIVAALNDKDPHLRAYALAELAATAPDHLPCIASKELIEALIDKVLKEKIDAVEAKGQSLLAKLFPDAGCESRKQWERYWREHEETWVQAPWVGPEPERDPNNRQTTAGLMARAMDLYEAGLDVAIVIDSTGSMQVTIDAAREAVGDIIAILSGVAPKFRLGLVHYQDFGDMGKIPAKILDPLSNKPEKVEKSLGRLVAGGGGDIPERVEFGLKGALSEEMEWARSTNKLLVLIGDAPPHAEARDEAVRLAKDAREKPFGVDPTDIAPIERDGRSRANSVVRPFITAAIAVGETQVEAGTKKAFQEIAQAGGGAYVDLVTKTSSASDASRAIARHIMRLSFGQQFAAQTEAFVDVYFDFRDCGYFD